MTTRTTRRLFLAVGSAGAVFGTLGEAVTRDPDPIAAAIERHRAAKLFFEAAEPGPDDETLGFDEMIDALRALVETPCANAESLTKKLEYLLGYEESLGPESMGICDEYATIVFAVRHHLAQARAS